MKYIKNTHLTKTGTLNTTLFSKKRKKANAAQLIQKPRWLLRNDGRNNHRANSVQLHVFKETINIITQKEILLLYDGEKNTFKERIDKILTRKGLSLFPRKCLEVTVRVTLLSK